ncbi:MAG: cyclic nucleotide-binding/CBS domain-containing protein [Holophagales bacterium]|nr:cyclic nucleotide-binding/CBS domain-containing protein [Holophagales bacterium]
MANDVAAPRTDPSLDPRSFLRAVPPFDALSARAFDEAAGALEIARFPLGTRILAADGSPSDALYVIRSGLVRLERNGEATDLLEEGDFFGYSVMTGHVLADVVVEEDLLAYRLPEPVFRSLLGEAPFARFFTQGLAARLRHQPAPGAEPVLERDALVAVGSLVERPAVTVPASATVLEAARVMRDERVSSVLLLSEPPAILTDRDLRNRVLAADLGPRTPAKEVASRPLRTVPHGMPVYGAWQVMLEQGIHHLPVERDGAVVGLVTSTDLLRHHSQGPVLALMRVERMRNREALPGYASDLARMVSTLARSGLPVPQIARFVSHLNGALVRRLLAWAEADLGPPPCPYAFLVFGSDGRYEQTLLTDQDNALVYADGARDAASYFESLAERVIADLVAAGFPPCPGGYMATRWRASLSEWKARFAGWIDAPRAEAVLAAATFFDHRAVGGSLDVSPLASVIARARGNAPFLSHLARAAVGFRPPIGAFRRLRADDGGIDLKKGGLAPVQGLARVWALDVGIAATSTLERLAAAAAAGFVDRERAEDLAEAYLFLAGLRLRTQLASLAAGMTPGNRVAVDSLSPSERRHLKESFLAVRDAQDAAVVRYHVTLA